MSKHDNNGTVIPFGGEPKKVKLLRIDAPHFCGGIELHNDICVRAAPIIGFMANERWSKERIETYCRYKGWRLGGE